jgi:hypothetical protein
MPAEPDTLQVPRRKLFWLTGAALLGASFIVVCFVLPAEFRIDPTGLGKATGVIRLAGPKTLAADELSAVIDEIAASADESDVSASPAVAGSAAGAGSATDAGADSVAEAGAPASTRVAASAPGVSGAGKPGAFASARYYKGGYRSDFVDIPLTVAGAAERGEELEYKVRMRAGATLAYSWSVEGIANPEEFYYDFHGEARANEKGARAPAQGTVVEYRQATGTQSHGTLVAPFDGVFGWYLQNQSEKPVVVRLKISGFYTLVPPGEYGNEAGIEANKPAPH